LSQTPRDRLVAMDGGPFFEVTEHELGDGLRLIDLHGELDLSTAARVRSALTAADEDGCKRVIVDLTDVPIIDSTGLSVLVVAHKRLSRTGRELVVILPETGMTTKFQIAGLDRFFSITTSRAEALDSGL
jgi:anti-sigma B factor antagonist